MSRYVIESIGRRMDLRRRSAFLPAWNYASLGSLCFQTAIARFLAQLELAPNLRNTHNL